MYGSKTKGERKPRGDNDDSKWTRDRNLEKEASCGVFLLIYSIVPTGICQSKPSIWCESQKMVC